MAVMGLRLAGRSNGVAQLHGEVSRDMFGDLWPDLESDETPSGRSPTACTPTPGSRPRSPTCCRATCCPTGTRPAPDLWARIAEAPDDELWRAQEQGRERMVTFVRRRLRQGAAARGLTGSDVAWTDEVLDPRVLTIGFARRFATYKRATLLLSQPERLRELLLSPDRPLQFVFAGKAHPADEQGKEMIRQIVAFSSDPEIRHRLVFVDDYDIAVARALYQGSRRVAEQPPPPPGGVRHVGHEGGAQRRAQPVDPRRLVARDVRRRERLGHLARPRTSRTSSAATGWRPAPCSTCWSGRSSRCSTSATAGRCRAAG